MLPNTPDRRKTAVLFLSDRPIPFLPTKRGLKGVWGWAQDRRGGPQERTQLGGGGDGEQLVFPLINYFPPPVSGESQALRLLSAVPSWASPPSLRLSPSSLQSRSQLNLFAPFLNLSLLFVSLCISREIHLEGGSPPTKLTILAHSTAALQSRVVYSLAI